MSARTSKPRKTSAPFGIYCRISQDRSGGGAGVERQREDGEVFGKERGLVVASTDYTDNDRSAYSGKPRPAYKRLLADLEAGVIGGVIAWHPDRLHRSPTELEEFIDLVERTGTQVFTVRAGEYDLSTAAGRMTARVVGAVARHESEQKSERVRRAMRQRAEQGRYNGGVRPTGYQVGDDGRLIIDKDEAKHIRDAAKALLRGRSMRSIADQWNEKKFRTPRGGEWVSQVARKVMLGPTIRGMRSHLGQVVDAEWSAILDEETAALVAALLTHDSRTTHGGFVARVNFMAGFVYCDLCKQRLVSGVTNKQPSMGCKVGQTPQSCGRIVVKRAALEEFVRDALIERVLVGTVPLREASKVERSDDLGDLVGKLDGYRARLAELEEDLIEGEVGRSEYKRQRSKYLERIADVESDLAQRGSESSLHDIPTTRAGLLDAWETRGIEWRRALLGYYVERVVVKPAAHRGARFSEDRVRVLWRRAGAQAA